jgi:hypothetical protein
MPARTSVPRVRLGALVAALLTCACMTSVFAASASADSGDWFCPVGGTSTISLGPHTGCTNSYYNKLTEVAYYHSAGANVNHCAVSKATDDPGGASSNVIPAVCGYGVAPHGELNTAYYGSGKWSYARGKNNEGATHYGFYGFRWWIA